MWPHRWWRRDKTDSKTDRHNVTQIEILATIRTSTEDDVELEEMNQLDDLRERLRVARALLVAQTFPVRERGPR